MKISMEIHFNRSETFIFFLRRIWCQSVRKKVNKCLLRISLFYRSSHRRCSAKKVFLKTLQYSRGNTCAGVFAGLQVCNFFKKRLQHLNVPVNIAKLLRIPTWRAFANNSFLFCEKEWTQLKIKQLSSIMTEAVMI